MTAKSITILIIACMQAAALEIPQDVESFAKEYRQRQTVLESQFKNNLTGVLASLARKYADRQQEAAVIQTAQARLSSLSAEQIFREYAAAASPAPPAPALTFLADEAQLSGGLERKQIQGKSILPFGAAPEASASWTATVPEAGWYRLDVAYERLHEHPTALRIKTGETEFTWPPYDTPARFGDIGIPVARLRLEQGNRPFSVEMIPGTDNSPRHESIGIRYLRLVRQEQRPPVRSPLPPLAEDELSVLVKLAVSRYHTSVADLRNGCQAGIDELKAKYEGHANAQYVKSTALVLNAIDTPSILDDVKAIADDSPRTQEPFKPEKNFLQGKWKQENGENEYVFWTTGRFAYYENGKRNNRLAEKRYDFNPQAASFYFENAQGFYETGITVLGPDSIRIRHETFRRVEEKKD